MRFIWPIVAFCAIAEAIVIRELQQQRIDAVYLYRQGVKMEAELATSQQKLYNLISSIDETIKWEMMEAEVANMIHGLPIRKRKSSLPEDELFYFPLPPPRRDERDKWALH